MKNKFDRFLEANGILLDDELPDEEAEEVTEYGADEFADEPEDE